MTVPGGMPVGVILGGKIGDLTGFTLGKAGSAAGLAVVEMQENSLPEVKAAKVSGANIELAEGNLRGIDARIQQLQSTPNMSSAQNYELQQLYSARADQAIKLGALQEDRRQQVELAQQAIAKYWGADSNIDDPEERSKAIESTKRCTCSTCNET
jgi:predicted DsbA family dithiol-disulfide isomerase